MSKVHPKLLYDQRTLRLCGELSGEVVGILFLRGVV